MTIERLAESLHPLERKVLSYLKLEGFDKIVKNSNLSEVEVIRALQWLENKNVIKTVKTKKQIISLGKNGEYYLKYGLPERKFLKTIEKQNLSLDEIRVKANLSVPEINVSVGLLRSKMAIIFGKKISISDQGKKILSKESFEEKFMKELPLEVESLNDGQKYAYNELKKRRDMIRVEDKKLINVELTNLGKKLSSSKLKAGGIEILTSAMLKTGSWIGKKFRKYDVEVEVPKIYPGKRHFVNEAKSHAKQIWLDMGFKEMTGPIINSSFWNFDSLFTAQDHPVREMQDTFFVKGKAKLPSKELVNKVKREHENVWKYKWDEEEAKKLVLRTHTTVLSAKTISELKKSDLPAKFFAIGRNYRNEALDWNHLFEFNQTEGIVIDPNANFKHLLGYLKEFFGKMGYDKVRFRPGYFAYVEPGVEVDAYIPERDKWVELGGAGIFRPEVVKPLLGIDIPVLAWGFGLGRITCPYFGIKDLRELYTNDIKQLREIKSWI